jgi:thioredoxin 1
MAIIVKIHPYDLPSKAESIDVEFFNKNIFDLNSDDLKFKGKLPVMVDFYTQWCGPCKSLSPIVDKLSDKYKGKIDIYKVDIEEHVEIAMKLGVRSVPTLLFVTSDGIPQMLPGAPQEQVLEDILESLINGNKESDDNNGNK